jgi:pimeloyl-ACP methyl ester carboxylesterase
MNCVQLNGLRTHYYVAGRGPDVVFTHGWAASGRMWLRSLWALRRHFRAWALDLAGFGASDSPGDAWYPTVEDCTDQVARFCQAMGIESATMVGHSLGGRDALLAGRFGEMLLSLSQRVWLLSDTAVMSQLAAPRYVSSESMRRASRDMQRASEGALFGSLRAVVNSDFSPNLPHVKKPVLIIGGERDFTVPPSDARLAAELISGAELVMLKNVHHLPSDEAPDVFHELVMDFARRGLVEGV